MKQRIDPRLTFNDRPNRDEVIERDEIISLVIDLEIMSPELFFSNYFSIDAEKSR